MLARAGEMSQEVERKSIAAQDSVQGASVAAAARREPFGGRVVALIVATILVTALALLSVLFI